MRADASDLRIVDEAGRGLSIEIEQAGALGGEPTIAWVRVPLIDSTEVTLFASFGRSGVTRTDVWSADYQAVWHLGNLADSTDNAHHGVALGTTVTRGVLASGRALDLAANNAILIADSPAFGFESFTISGWVNGRSSGAMYGAVVAREYGDTAEDDYFLGTRLGLLRAATQNTGGQNGGDGGLVSLGTWHHLVLTSDPARVRGYLDGVMQADAASAPGTPVHSAAPIFLGANRNNFDGTNGRSIPDNAFIDGILDEIRIETVARSPAWIAYDHAAQRDEVITYVAPSP
jgi:hypothetical protein